MLEEFQALINIQLCFPSFLRYDAIDDEQSCDTSGPTHEQKPSKFTHREKQPASLITTTSYSHSPSTMDTQVITLKECICWTLTWTRLDFRLWFTHTPPSLFPVVSDQTHLFVLTWVLLKLLLQRQCRRPRGTAIYRESLWRDRWKVTCVIPPIMAIV